MLERGELPFGYVVSTLLTRSWRRSIDAGLSPEGRLVDSGHLDAAQLARRCEEHRELIAHAQPVMEYLHAQTRESGSMVILADEKGVLLQALGDPSFLTRAARVALAPGSSWDERYRGTNAIGTALAESRPVVVHGGEHFLERNGFLSCTAVPLTAPDGHLLGVLDISGDERQHHPHTSGLVHTAAQMIENRLFESYSARSLRIRFHPMAEGIGTFAEGVAILSEDGWIVGANRCGLALLGLQIADLHITPLTRILQVRITDLLDWSIRRAGETMLVACTTGARMFVRIEPGVTTLTASRRTPGPALAAVHKADALDELDTGDERMALVIAKARKLIDRPVPLLLQGETGVGKAHFARAFHASSEYRAGRFVTVNCRASPENPLETALFGSGADADAHGQSGCLCEADGGTLFLDDVGELPPHVQTRLLNVLRDKRITLTGSKTTTLDFMLICTTRRSLTADVETGRLNPDLYYRINGMTLHLPALRERTDFLPVLVHLLETLAPDHQLSLEPALATAFAGYSWPGNLHQLCNALRTAQALLDDGEHCIGWQHLADDLCEELRWQPAIATSSTDVQTENLRELSNATISRAVATSRGNMSEAARRLGISRNTLYRRLNEIRAGSNKEDL